ncbi:MAG: hypothetical protein FWG67_03290, partial [Defluviitaleaceae bacterium]|nr:hypothetical protein [Defluviitaleaceae bacterium]
MKQLRLRKNKKWAFAVIAFVAMVVLAGCADGGGDGSRVEITNVAFDPARELFDAYNSLFQAYWDE